MIQKETQAIACGLVALFFLLAGPVFSEDSVPKRIVSLGPPITEQLYLLGCGSEVVGVTVYCERPPEARKKEKIGTVLQPDIEKIVSLRPDLVLATPLTSVQAIGQLKQLGLNVVAFPACKDFDRLCEQFLELGSRVGKTEEARKIVSTSKSRVEQISAKARQRTAPPRRVFVELGMNPLFTANKDYFIHNLIELAGGVNVAADAGSGLYSLEQVIAQNPDVILIPAMGIPGEAEKKNWQQYTTMNAVKNSKIFFLDAYKSCSPTPVTFVETLEEVARLLAF